MINSLANLLSFAGKEEKERLVIVAAEDTDVLGAAAEAKKLGLVEPILVGNETLIREKLNEAGMNDSEYIIVPAGSMEESVAIGLGMVKDGEADFIMKGLVDTAILLKGVLNKDYGLRQESLLSHVMLYEMDSYHKLIGLTDGGMNIAPSYEQKEIILKNGVKVLRSLGLETVKACGLAAKEKVSPKMQATVDADELVKFSKENLQDVIFEGPLALDLALSKEAAEVKKFKSEVAGDVDLILVPTIEVGNALGKSMTYLAGAKSAGIIMGAKVPVVLVSRADSYESKLYSIALGKMISRFQREEK